MDLNNRLVSVINDKLISHDICFDEVKRLIELGATVMESYGGSWPLHVAAGRDRTEVVKLLVTSNPGIRGLGLALAEASKTGNLEMMRFLIEAGADVNYEHDRCLAAAAQYGQEDAARLLISSDANVNGKALSLAVFRSHDLIADMLVASGAELTGLYRNEQISHPILIEAIKKYASTAKRGYTAVMLLDDNDCVKVLRHLHPDTESTEIREDLNLMEALGLNPDQRADMWKERHSAAIQNPWLVVSP